MIAALLKRGHCAGLARASLALAATAMAVALVLSCASMSGTAWAGGEASGWRFAPAQAPPPPPGVSPAPYGVPLGQVGEISFWTPNRGLLITGGTEASGGPVPAGLYAYDGVSWHQLSTVCGGAEGRIVWAGPDEFWTVSDQRAGQQISSNGAQTEARAVSLCHFQSGKVVGSYAMPLDEADSWLHMTAGACYTPSDCWFGGGDGLAPNRGTFHLHWDGSTVSAVYEPEDHAVTGMVSFQGTLYESVRLSEADEWLPEEERKHPAVIHTIAPAGTEPLFSELPAYSPAAKHLLPLYGEKVLPEALQGFDLQTDGSPAGLDATQLWAAADPVRETPSASKTAAVTVLHQSGGTWSQVTPAAGAQPALGEGETLAGARTEGEWGVSQAIAPLPGSEAAWLSVRNLADGAAVALLGTDGKLLATDLLPNPGEEVGYRGKAGPIVCPAPADCWMATFEEPVARAGWLFHLTDGTQLERDGDPFFDGEDGVITYRPPDAGVPVVYPDVPPEDDSLANQAPPPPPPPAAAPTPHTRRKARPLVLRIESRMLHHRTLVISFTLTASAHVRLIGRRGKRVVAQTPMRVLRPGRHSVSLTFHPARWPSALQFVARPFHGANSRRSR